MAFSYQCREPNAPTNRMMRWERKVREVTLRHLQCMTVHRRDYSITFTTKRRLLRVFGSCLVLASLPCPRPLLCKAYFRGTKFTHLSYGYSREVGRSWVSIHRGTSGRLLRRSVVSHRTRTQVLRKVHHFGYPQAHV